MFEMLMYRWVQEWRWTTAGRRYGSFSLQFVGKSREISQADLEINSKLSKDGQIFLVTFLLYAVITIHTSHLINLQVSMSAPAIFPVGPKWIRTNFPCVN